MDAATKLRCMAVALGNLTNAQAVLGMNDAEFAEWLVDLALQLKPASFEDDEQGVPAWATIN